NNLSRAISLSGENIRFIADRHLGVGCDQLLLIEPARNPENDFSYRIFNADGGEVEQCGNGARCFTRYVYDRGLTDKKAISMETLGGVITGHIEQDNQVRVDMGTPVFEPGQIPFSAEAEAETYELEALGNSWNISAVSMGNPHAVLVVDNVDAAPVNTLGPEIEHHARFPQRVNVGFMQVIDNSHIRLRVFERGAGETQACGTGACAAVVTGIRRGLLENNVQVSLQGGDLLINWDSRNNNNNVWLTGPTTYVFEGVIEL
ncbi:MAG: diaminopimelate epimerase, partial [Gammaproteobacteria bacterium]|nr:diaminopimelate epimerase [Gammaproteobacteria bacterium]